MKLGILSALWGRPELTRLFLDRMEHLKNELGVVPGVVGSDNQFREDCEKRGVLYTDHINKPLGLKWNHGIKLFQDTDVTHIMILGSDDFVSDDFIEFSMEFAEDKDFTGCLDMYMYGAHPKRRGWRQLFYFRYPGLLVGPGRVYSRRIIDGMNWKPWGSNRNSGLDGSIAKSVKMLGGHVKKKSFIMKDEGLFMVDIKTSGNISGIPGGAKPIDDNFINMLKSNLPKEEAQNLINHLTEKGAI